MTRFFVTATKGYSKDTPVLRFLKSLPGVRSLNWEQSHLVIQQQWFKAGGRFSLFPEASAEILGLRALGQAGWNVMPLPSAINQGLARSPWAMSALGLTVEGGTAYGAWKTGEYVQEGVKEVLRDEWSQSASGQ